MQTDMEEIPMDEPDDLPPLDPLPPPGLMNAARERGRIGGKKVVMTQEKYDHARALKAEGHKVADIYRKIGVSRTVYYVHKDRINAGLPYETEGMKNAK